MPALVTARSVEDVTGGRSPQFISAVVNVVCVITPNESLYLNGWMAKACSQYHRAYMISMVSAYLHWLLTSLDGHALYILVFALGVFQVEGVPIRPAYHPGVRPVCTVSRPLRVLILTCSLMTSSLVSTSQVVLSAIYSYDSIARMAGHSSHLSL